jgi:hypothetical protein
LLRAATIRTVRAGGAAGPALCPTLGSAAVERGALMNNIMDAEPLKAV